jgi:tetratricopeptide (TPR) repeat protein
LAATGTIYQDEDGHWRATEDLRTAGLPVSIREVVGQRVRSLGEETYRVLTLASVIGRDFDLDLLERVAEMDADQLVDLCDAAVEAQVLRERDRGAGYTFAHALIERTLYDNVSANRRARAHRSVAEALEDLTQGEPGPRVGELAYHWAQATRPSDTGKAVAYAGQAGDRALAALAPADAALWYRRALELLEGDPSPNDRQRAELLVGLGDAQRQIGIAAYRETLLQAAWAADRADDVSLLSRAALTNTRGWQSRTDGTADDERLAVLNRALARSGEDATGTRARLLALSGIEQIYTRSLEERVALASEAVALARASGDATALVHVLSGACRSIAGPPTHAQRLAWSAEGVRVADDLGDPFLRLLSSDMLTSVALESADRDTFDERLRVRADLVETLPHASFRWSLLFHQAVQAILMGDLQAAEDLATEALNLGLETGQDDAFRIYGAQLLNVRIRQGRLGELVTLVEDSVTNNPDLPVYRAVLAVAYASTQDLDRTRQLLDAEFTEGFPIPQDSNSTTAFQYWSEAAVLLGRRPAAEALLGMIAPFAEFVVTTNVTASPVLAHTMGRLQHSLDRHDEADASFQLALRLHQGLRSPLYVCTTQAAWAALLADRDRGDDRTRARVMAEDALRTSSDGGYRNVEHDASAVLERLA